jgi:hypothetical protein
MEPSLRQPPRLSEALGQVLGSGAREPIGH